MHPGTGGAGARTVEAVVATRRVRRGNEAIEGETEPAAARERGSRRREVRANFITQIGSNGLRTQVGERGFDRRLACEQPVETRLRERVRHLLEGRSQAGDRGQAAR